MGGMGSTRLSGGRHRDRLTAWRGKVNGHWRAMEQATVRKGRAEEMAMERDKVYDRG